MTVLRLDAEWLSRPQTQALMSALGGDAVRAVGGCVRDTLLDMYDEGEAGRAKTAMPDVDLATQLLPEIVQEKLEGAGFKVVPTGLKHGTLTAILDGFHYEVTTLRRDVATDGRHAEVVFGQDWEADAARRDFTLNALYCDAQGQVYDPLGTGLADLQAKKLRFIGNPEARIAEDYLRILRFFRFHYLLSPKAKMDAPALAACEAAKDQLVKLSGERKREELFKILTLPKVRFTINAMHETGILEPLLGCEGEGLWRLLHQAERHEEKYGRGEPDTLLRLMALVPYPDPLTNVAKMAERLRLSNKQKKRMEKAFGRLADRYDYSLSAGLYFLGPETLRDQALILKSYPNFSLPHGFGFIVLTDDEEENERRRAEESARAEPYFTFWERAETVPQDWQRPQFPVTGDRLAAAGVTSGPQMGKYKKALELWWAMHDFPDAETVMQQIDKIRDGTADWLHLLD